MKNILILLTIITAASALHADFIVMKNGTCYQGEISRKDGGVAVIETIEKIITVKEDEIAKVTEGTSLVELYHTKRKEVQTAYDHLKLAEWCFKNRFFRAGYAERAMAKKCAPEMIVPNTAEKKAEVKKEKTEEERLQIRKTVAIKKHAIRLRRDWCKDSSESHKKKLSEFTIKEKSPVYIDQLKHDDYEDWRFRSFLFDELKKNPEIDNTVYIEHILREPSDTLKENMVHFLVKNDVAKKQLENKMIEVVCTEKKDFNRHMNAVNALGMMRSWRSVPLLLKKFKIIWGGGARSHYFIGTVNPYVRDVTPVVATGATSFDPEIDTYTTGVVLDVKVSSIERHIVSRTLRNITGYYLQRPQDWFSWWENNGWKEYAQHMELDIDKILEQQKKKR